MGNCAAAFLATQNQVLFFGGVDDNNGVQAKAWVYEFKTLSSISGGRWRSVGPLSEGKAGMASGVVQFEGEEVVIVVGGYYNNFPIQRSGKVGN